jgi:hypothetical protein
VFELTDGSFLTTFDPTTILFSLEQESTAALIYGARRLAVATLPTL